jgi:hypothetical protein
VVSLFFKLGALGAQGFGGPVGDVKTDILVSMIGRVMIMHHISKSFMPYTMKIPVGWVCVLLR